MKKTGLLLIIMLAVMLPSLAQDSGFIVGEGEVVEGEFVISKELEIILPSAQRVFQKVPPEETDSKEIDPIRYTFNNYTPQIVDFRTRLRVLKLKNDNTVISAPGSYLTLGFGNYFTPYLNAGLNSGPSKTGNYGLNVYHLSSRYGPVDKENSGDGHSSVNLFGEYIGSKASLGGNLEYNLDKYNFYGYDEGEEVDKDTIGQKFNDIQIGFAIESTDAGATLQYEITGNAYNINDSYSARETAFSTSIAGDYTITEDMYAHLSADLLFSSYKNPEKINRSFTRVNPAFIFEKNGFTINAGLNIIFENDTINDENNTKIYPALSLAYALNDDISAYGVLEGDVEEVTYKKMVNENPWVAENIPVANTTKNFEIMAGLKGSLIQYLAFDVGIKSALYKNMYFFLNDPAQSSKFNIVFDEGTTSLFQGFMSLSYYRNNTLGSTLSARFNAYNTSDIDKAWEKPKVEFEYTFWYNFFNKVKLTTDFFVVSGIQSVNFEDVNNPVTVKLNPAIDLNFKIDYILSERFSVFVSADNILNNNYQLYYRYPTRGLLAMLGVSVSF